ncbi:MAG: phosphopantothenoylcysteine decarboxylase [Phycisphaerae bacterium]|nr:phosphopantothenoylcysteine decarboxylase [Phycisphaerae bacterium]NUQ49133.1 phosphopantothenoylcysteine decarboxylase [Phycisphaerae bacterium]
MALDGYEVLLCVCGGIAAYKSAALASRLVQDGCGVTVAMTRAARHFVGPLTFRALTGRPVHASLFSPADGADIQHLRLSELADLIVVAPATASVMAKTAAGLADDLVSCLLIGADCPVLMAPAMNTRMWAHPAVQRNVAFLREMGVHMLGPESGWQACRAVGPGRMSEPERLAQTVRDMLLARPARRGRPRE